MTDHPKFDRPARLSPAFAFEAKAGAAGEIEGLASPFGGPPDAYGDTVAPGAFAATLADWRARGDWPPMLWAHQTDKPVGRWAEMRETAAGLAVRGQFNLATTAGREAHEHARAGDVRGLSIGYSVPEGGAKFDGGGRVLTAVELWEVSLVTIPAAREARVTAVKAAADFARPSELRSALREAGFSKAAAERIAAGGWAALAGHDPEAEAEAADLIRNIRAAAAAFAKG